MEKPGVMYANDQTGPCDVLFAWVSTDRKGNETIVWQARPTGILPLIAQKREYAEAMGAELEKVKADNLRAGFTTELVEFRRVR